MNKKTEKQLSFLLPIIGKRADEMKMPALNAPSLRNHPESDKTYLKIRESLRNKGLVKPQ